MKRLFCFFLVYILLLSPLWTQEMTLCPEVVFSKTDHNEPFGMSSRPITNLEYLTYLCWLEKVFRIDYPSVLFDKLPFYADCSFEMFEKEGLIVLAKSKNEITKNYFLNPTYLNHPVIGINWHQAMSFNKWLSDRYNEAILVSLHFFENYPYQVNEDCFVVESVYTNQYVSGSFIDAAELGYIVQWKDKILTPAFRLPIKKELKSIPQLNTELKAYPYFPFLKYWIDRYFEIDQIAISVKSRGNPPLKIGSSVGIFDLAALGEIKELSFENSSNEAENLEEALKNKDLLDFGTIAIKDQDGLYVEKDSLGNLPFIIYSETEKQEPVFSKNIQFIKSISNSSTNDNNTIFRFSVSMNPSLFKVMSEKKMKSLKK